MEEIKKMLKAIINSQSAFRQEVFKKFDEIELRFRGVDERFDTLEKNLTARIDKVGKQLAYLEDDAPTREEFDSLEMRVDKIEHKSPPI